jgi:hypothetical protein
MGKRYRYVMIPLDQVPKDPSYPVWFGTWSSDTQKITWSRDRPGATAAWTVAITSQDLSAQEGTMDLAVPGVASQGITILGDGGTKDPPPPLQVSSPDSTALQAAFTSWLSLDARSA